MARPVMCDVVRARTVRCLSRRGLSTSGAMLALEPRMETTEGTRLEKALVVAACFPFLMIGLLFLFS